jgi:uncharacterized membrane protein YfcA
VHELLTIFSGSLVGFSLGLVGGGGSLLAVPLLVYVVGVESPHIAIGTSAVAVAASAALSLFTHARMDHVKWRCALVFAAAGVAGAWLGAALGKRVESETAHARWPMIAVGALMPIAGQAARIRMRLTEATRGFAPLLGIGFVVGLLGFRNRRRL